MGKLYEENWYQKWKKETFLGKIPEAVPVRVQGCTSTAQQNANCIDTGPSCTGTPQQNATCTGTGQRCTGKGVPKMPRLCSFCVIKLKCTHQSYRNLIK